MLTIKATSRLALAPLAVLALFSTTALAYSDVTWTGSGTDDNWATAKNWNPQTSPLSSDSVFFTDAGSTNAPGVVTNFLPADQTVANLSYANDNTYHTTDLQGYTLDVSGILQVNTNKNGGTQTTLSNGTLRIGTALQPGNLYVARQLQSVNNSIFATLDLTATTFDATLNTLISGQKSQGGEGGGLGIVLGGSSGNIQIGSLANPGTIWIGRTTFSGSSTGLVDFSNQTSFTATVGDFWLGTADGGYARGTMYLSPSNTIQANSIRVGYSSQSDSFNGTSVLRLGANNVIGANEFVVGGRRSMGSVEIVSGGSLTLGTAEAPTALLLAQYDQATNFEQIGTVNLQGATFNAHLSRLVVADKTAGNNGGANATLLGGNQGAIVIGSEAQPGQILIGHNTQGSSALGQLDLGGQTSLTADVDQFLIGVATNGLARGNVTLAQSNTIHANAIIVGQHTSADNYNNPSTLELGMQNDIVAGQLLVGGRRSSATLETPIGAVVNLGTEASPTSLVVGRNDADSGANPNQNASASFAGATWNAYLSELIVAEKSGGSNGNSTSSLLGGSQGALVVGSQASPGNIYIGRNVNGNTVNAVADLGDQDSLTATVQQLLVGYAASGLSRGTLILPHTNTIDADTIFVGHSLTGDNYSGGIPSVLRLGDQNDITANQVVIGGRRSVGQLEIPAGGTLNLGTELKPASLVVGRNDADTGANPNQSATASLAGATFNAHLSELIVGEKSAGPNGSTTASLVGGSQGDLVIGSEASPGNIYVGRNLAGSSATGQLNLGGQDSLLAHIDRLHVGYTESSSARGNVTLAESNEIHANQILIGYSAIGNNTQNNTLALGAANVITAGEFVVGGNLSNGAVTIAAGGSLSLGTVTERTALVVGRTETSTSTSFSSSMNLAAATFNAFLSQLSVGDKTLASGSVTGTLLGATAGNVAIGAPGELGNIFVGRSLSGGSAVGTVDFSGLTSFSANLNQMVIGSNGNGTFLLPATSAIDAQSMLVGANGAATLMFGADTTLLVDEFQVGNSYSDALVDIQNPDSFELGAANRRANLAIGSVATNTNSTYSATVDLGGAAVNAYLNNLTVGLKDNGLAGATKVKLVGGNAGSISVGDSGNTANMTVGVGTNAIVDLGGMDEFDANLHQLTLGGTGGNATATLPANNTIDAQSMILGSNGNATLMLGLDNTILVDDLRVGVDFGIGLIQIPSGGVLNLGTPVRPTNLRLATGSTNSNSTFSGKLDLTNGTVHAHFGAVILGQKDNLPGRVEGTLTISDHPDNTVVADTIFMGGTNADGRLNFGGGSLSVHSISRGDGTAVFNWAGGALRIDTFGTPAYLMDLNNASFGTLAVGYSTDSTAVYGNYLQGAAATFEVEEQLNQFDHAIISKNATLDGELSLVLTPGFDPAIGETFLILTAAAVSGVFSDVNGYYAGGDTFVYPVYHPTFVELEAFLVGDSNFDGIVDAADYTNWADHFLEEANGVEEGDFNGDGVVDAGDYTLWADHYTAGGAASAAASAVPEPSSWALLASGLVGLFVRCVLRRTR